VLLEDHTTVRVDPAIDDLPKRDAAGTTNDMLVADFTEPSTDITWFASGCLPEKRPNAMNTLGELLATSNPEPDAVTV
jgi:hypothetical protein